jgi:hypothetical protein
MPLWAIWKSKRLVDFFFAYVVQYFAANWRVLKNYSIRGEGPSTLSLLMSLDIIPNPTTKMSTASTRSSRPISTPFSRPSINEVTNELKIGKYSTRCFGTESLLVCLLYLPRLPPLALSHRGPHALRPSPNTVKENGLATTGHEAGEAVMTRPNI